MLNGFTSVKVFSATMHKDRDALGAVVTSWIAANKPAIVDTVVTQSSDSSFHCITISVFYK